MTRTLLLLTFYILLASSFAMNGQITYVPDDNFEQALINLGLDNPPRNDSIPTKNIDTVTYLNVSYKFIINLTGIEDFKSLKKLDCSYNKLTILNVSKNNYLNELYCNTNQLITLDVSNNPQLEVLKCFTNQLSSLDVSRSTALEVLYCHYNLISSLDVSKNTGLRELYCYRNQLSRLDLIKNTNLWMIYCYENQLTSLDVSNCISLDELYCYSNMLTSLDVSKNKSLYALWSYSNQLKYLDVSKNYNLLLLDVRNNPNLTCIQVDDSSWASRDSDWHKDSTAHYSENCNYTAVEDNKFENEPITISPNPASDYIEISYPPSEKRGLGGVSTVIYDVLGMEQPTSPQPLSMLGEGVMRLDISHLAPGVYFVRVGDVVRKFVKM